MQNTFLLFFVLAAALGIGYFAINLIDKGSNHITSSPSDSAPHSFLSHFHHANQRKKAS